MYEELCVADFLLHTVGWQYVFNISQPHFAIQTITIPLDRCRAQHTFVQERWRRETVHESCSVYSIKPNWLFQKC